MLTTEGLNKIIQKHFRETWPETMYAGLFARNPSSSQIKELTGKSYKRIPFSRDEYLEKGIEFEFQNNSRSHKDDAWIKWFADEKSTTALYEKYLCSRFIKGGKLNIRMTLDINISVEGW